MSYKALQEKAKELGLKYVGVSEKDLKKAIAEKTGASNVTPPLEPGEPDEKEVSLKLKEAEKNADAVVYSGKRKVRTYTLEQHGKDYVKLAERYVSHPEREGYKIEFETVETRLTCPHCGKKFRYN